MLLIIVSIGYINSWKQCSKYIFFYILNLLNAQILVLNAVCSIQKMLGEIADGGQNILHSLHTVPL